MYGPLSTISRAQMEQQFSANFFGAHQLTMRLLPAMLPHGEGRIVMNIIGDGINLHAGSWRLRGQ
ncbi:putative short chain dehydrogenase [Escherichia coli]|nr:putative short chain dehydrogenase [Escherichia coli]